MASDSGNDDLSARALSDLPEVHAGDDLAELIVTAARSARPPHDYDYAYAPPPAPLRDGQIVAVAHKVVSKAEGAVVALDDVQPSPRARELAEAQHKDARAIQVVLDQSAEIVRAERDVLICRTHRGFVCANAGVDASNASAPDTLVVLPRDPDASARALRARLHELTGAILAVLITDSFGRAWRHGQCDVALGCAGMAPLEDWRGRSDARGLRLRATWLAVADAIAATADLARAKDSREPVVLIGGLQRFVTPEDGPGAAALLRPLEEDMFR
ncbi:MAG TPA: coenzyme F420-0:L-glutamate ligase [Solirubrobacteraceae bacterium]|nr:coenzyme F420-0:L-glutamate ligase [Solirubrobacteraceae bacterium]